MNLKSERLSIEETDHVEKRSERSEEARQKALSEQGDISEQVRKLESEKESNAMASLADRQRLYGLLILLIIVLFVADWPIQYGLNSVAFPKLSWLILIILAVLVAAGIGVVVEVAAFAMFFDPYRPRRTVRLCLTSAGISGGLAAVAGTVLLFSRTATGGMVDFLVQAVPVSMWVLGECLPVTAGFLSAAAWTLGYPQRRDFRIDGLKARLSELGRFLDWVERDKQKIVSRTVTMLLCGFLLIGPALCQGGHALPAAPPTQAGSGQMNITSPTAATQPGTARTRCLVAVDMTASVDPESRRTGVSLFLQSLPQFISAFHCTALVAGTFADEGAYAPLSEFQVFPPPPAEDCSRATFEPTGMEKITQNISSFQAHYQKIAAERCQAGLRAHLTNYTQKTHDLVRDVGAALNPDLPTRGQCTAIYGLLSWAARRSNVVVLLTDGLETCDRERTRIRVPEHPRSILILVPSRKSTNRTGPSALQLATSWEGFVPGLIAVMSSEVNAGLWPEIAARPIDPKIQLDRR